jgi:exodeoxyribonuclease V
MSIQLNRGQQAAFDAAVDWYYNSSSTLFQIASEAGCGKSVLVGEIVRALRLKQEEILPMAYTGQAAIVMRTHGLPNACTCHSGLFDPIQVPLRDTRGAIMMDERFNTPLVRYEFRPKDLRNSNIKLIILDEAWMIPKSFKKHIDATGIKVIATGDQGQLPPIAEEPGYLVGDNIFYLTELMRQSMDSPLVYLAHKARAGYPIGYGLYGNDVLVISEDELTDEMLAKADVVLCGTNATRNNINNRVRQGIYKIYSTTPVYGDRIICRKNNWAKSVGNIALVNGLVGTVYTPPDISTYDKNRHTVSIDFLPDMCRVPFNNLEINFEFLMQDNAEIKNNIRKSPFTRGELFEFAYASTVHLAQGSEYNYGIYIEEYLGGNVEAALNYTAITRFKKKMIYVKRTPKFWVDKY